MKKLMIAVLACSVASGVMAAGFQMSLTPEIAIQDRNEEINGVSIGVWNENPSPQFQWSFGFVNGATGDSVGVQWFVFLPTIYIYAENYKGLQWGWVNNTSGEFTGAQFGVVNVTQGKFTGFQWGGVNYAADLVGLQLGVVNWAQKSTSGVQIGLANIIPENEWFKDGDFGKGMIIFNWGF